jgi:hypothetical protein
MEIKWVGHAGWMGKEMQNFRGNFIESGHLVDWEDGRIVLRCVVGILIVKM